jgi:hypothetical protein
MAPITVDELYEQVKRSPKQSSPGADGLGYQYLKILFQIPSLEDLIVTVYNNALSQGSTPSSWKDIRVQLLPKKGDLTDLKNWRPISLINCDAKIFTRVLNLRLSCIANKIIQPTQTGFMPNRFIGDNGLALHLLIQQARFTKFTGIGLLLDQEKAYDRVNPMYLIKVLAAFGFNDKFIRCIHRLFFGNLAQINVNGFFSPTVHQQRGLRQGDPLSPLLFNLALEPLLLAINQDNRITGYRFVQEGVDHYVKTLAYADDICTILQNQDDYHRLQYHLERYSSVSNAKFNQQKTEAFSLSGKYDRDWKELLQHHHITVYHTHNSSEPFRYLGYYIYYTNNQRDYLQEKMIAQVKDQVQLYSTRQLSIRGRATVISTLIMSKIWYRLRLIQPTQMFFKKLKSVIYGFVWLNKKPPLSFNQMCLPMAQGGLGIIHPQKQHLCLQIRHLHHLFSMSNRSTLVQPLFVHHMSIIANSASAPLLSFYVPELRKHDLNHSTSILHTVYKAFDHFNIQPDFSHMSLQNLLLLPLHYLIQTIPDDHWINRHRHFPASHFFKYDTAR